MEPEPKRRQLVPVLFEKSSNASSSEMCESTESGICSSSNDIHLYFYWRHRRSLLCMYNFGRENHELKKALKVSATVFFIKDFISSCLDISPWDCWYVILLMGIICRKTSRMSAISFLFVRSLKEKCSII